MKILGILNVTADSFSDGGKYLDPAAALAHAETLARDGADIIDIGAASSHPDAQPVVPETEIARLAALVPVLRKKTLPLSIDSFSTVVQRWALEQGVDYLNDIHGFADPSLDVVLLGDDEAFDDIAQHLADEGLAALKRQVREGGLACYLMRVQCDLVESGYETFLHSLGAAFLGACR